MPPTLPCRHAPAGRVILLAATVLFAVACGTSDGTVTISGDVAGLDTLGFKGDSLFARADAQMRALDSLRAVAEGRLPTLTPSAGAGVAADTANRATGSRTGRPANPMTLRAQARGDSMARASALRLAGRAAAGRSRGDTVRGVLTIVGVAPAKQVVLKADRGATTISLSGMATTGLSRLAGTELMVRGVKITPRDVVVSDYIVRGVDGVPVYDGRLEGGANGWWLSLSDGSGRKAIASLPSALQGLEGTRVWIAIKPGSATAHSYGVITRR